MNTYTIPCPRCHGRGIYYTSVHNGQPVPAKPDHGTCYQCHGAKTIQIRKEEKTMTNNTNTNQTYKILKHIKGHTAVYSEIPFTKEEQRDFLSKNYLLLDNSKDNPILAYNNPYYDKQVPTGAMNRYGYPNNKYTKETKPLHTLLWKLLLNEPFHISFRYFDFHTNITPIQSIKDFTQYALSNGIRVQLHDLSLDYKITLQPVQSTGEMQAAYWEQLNDQLSEYNKLLKEHYQLRQLESYTPVTLQYYLGPESETALDYILTWAPAYELDINFPTTEPQTTLVLHKDGSYTVTKDHFNDPKYHSKDIASLYTQLKYYEQVQEPITNPTQIICECGYPVSIYDQSAISPTSIYYEALGNSGYYLEKAHQVTCQHCFNTYIYDLENDEYELITEDYKENLTVISKLDNPNNTTKADDWWNRPLQPTNSPAEIILPDLDIFMEMLTAYQELHPEHSLKKAIYETNLNYHLIYSNKTA